MTLDILESTQFELPRPDRQKLESFGKAFASKLKPENGIYGVQEIIKDNGTVERIGKNNSGHTYKEYYRNGKIFEVKEILGNHENAITLYDDNGIAYEQTVRRLDNNKATVVSRALSPDTTITLGNYTAITDAYGRPISAKVTDLKLNNSTRPNTTRFRDNSYLVDDQVGHLIPHIYCGPTEKVNLVPQSRNVNLSQIKRVENIIKDLKNQGHSVDYEVKTNYIGTKDMRPSSFEPKITVDGREYTDLPDDLKKIYNNSDSEAVNKLAVTAGEKFGIAHELGMKNCLIAAGLTCTISTVENVSSFVDGEISGEDMAVNIVKDTAASGALAYGTAFISTGVAQAMSKSGSALISKIGSSCLPAAAVSFALDSFDSVVDFAKGEIDGAELAYDLGESAVTVAGSFGGGALFGAALGSVAGPVGSVAGGIVGGMIGCVVASEVYETAVQMGVEGAGILGEHAKNLAQQTSSFFKDTMPEKYEEVKSDFNDFFQKNNLPLKI